MAVLPTELWVQILTTAIHVPMFFDTDPFEIYSPDLYSQYHWQCDYWTSERTRNALRRVCRLWDSILSHYDHRFAQIQDVCLGKIPITALPKAYRIHTERTSQKCTCRWCSSHSPQEVTPIELQTVCEQLHRQLAVTPRWNLQIFTDRVGHVPLCELVLSHAHNLAVYISVGIVAFPKTDTTRSLRFIHTWGTPSGTLYQTRFDQVTTLCISTKEGYQNVNGFNLPHLRHLSIRQQIPSLESIYPLLERFGRHVITFRLHTWGVQSKIPSRIWALLPNVETIHLPYIWGLIPPEHVNLKIVIISTMMATNLLPGVVANPALRLHKPRWSLDGREWSGPQIRLNNTWLHKILLGRSMFDALRMEELYSACGYTLLDAEGTALHSQIIFMIRFYWKQGAAKAHRRCMNWRVTANYVF